MKPFSMESVLRYRHQLEDKARQKLFADLKKEEEIRAELQRTADSLSRLYADLTRERTQGTTVDRLLLFEHHTVIKQEKIELLQADLEKQEKVIERRRRHLLQASQDKKALENLKERQNLAYKKYTDKKEAAMLDEIAVLRYNR
ncbi:MAG: flagellar export protein FliJ [Desulfobulbaceae bacterium]|nr:flagellar export protein FliJ [Desulfobulbaceae bacterium]